MSKKPKILFLTLALTFSITVISQELNYSNKVYSEKIEYGKIEYPFDFNTLNENEIELEKESIEENKKSIERITDSIKLKFAEDIKKWSENSKYSNNRSKIFWGNIGKKKTEITLPCHCTKKNDTLTIVSGFGFFGGAGVAIKFMTTNFPLIFILIQTNQFSRKVKMMKSLLNL